MTVIAYRFPYIVADQRVTCGSIVAGSMEKLRTYRRDNRVLYMGAAGDAGHVDNIFEYICIEKGYYDPNPERLAALRELLVPDPKNEGRMDTLLVEVIDDKATFWCYDDDLSSFKFEHPFYAEGSGMRNALGAFYTGADAWHAVAAACAQDTMCGFPVVGYDVRTGQRYKFKTEADLADPNLNQIPLL